MNILILRNVLIFTLLILGQQSFAQSINDANLQKILTENPSILNNIPQQDKTTFDNKLISENQNVANTDWPYMRIQMWLWLLIVQAQRATVHDRQQRLPVKT